MSLMQFLNLLRARFKLIVLVVVPIVAATALIVLLMPKQYVASASVVVGPNGTGTLVNGRPIISEPVGSIVATQQDIIGSQRVAEKVVDRLGLDHNPDAWNLIGGGGINPLAKVRSWIRSLLPKDDDGGGAAGSAHERMANALLARLHLSSQPSSRVIKVGYVSDNPKFAADAANAFADQYMATVLKLHVQPAKANSQWLNGQTKQLKANLEQAQAKLAAFQRKTGLVGGDKLDLENARLTQLSTQLVAAQAQGYDSNAHRKQLKSFLKRGGSAPTEVQANPMVQQLRLRITQQQATLSELSHRVGRNHPQYRAAVTELMQLRGELSTEQRTVAKGLLDSTGVSAQQVAALQKAIAQQKAKILRLTGGHDQAALLQQNVDNARQAYSNTLQQAGQANMESQVDRADVSMIAPAIVPDSPSSPRVGLSIAIALVAGTVLGIGFALWAELNNRYVRSPDDILEFFGAPVLAVLDPAPGRRQAVRSVSGPTVRSLLR